MTTKKQQKTPRKSSNEHNALKEGKKAIEMQKKLDGKSPKQSDKDNKADAEKWHNEG